MTLGENSKIKAEDLKEEQKACAYLIVMDCFTINDKDVEKLMDSFNAAIKKISEEYQHGLYRWSKNSKKRSDKEISDYFLKCNKEFINKNKNFSQRIINDFPAL